MDRIARGISVRIERWIEQVEGGNALTNSDIRWLVGKDGLAAHEAQVRADRAERDAKAKSIPDVMTGNVPNYRKALRAAYDATVAVNRAKSTPPKGKGKKADEDRRKWRERRDLAHKLQEAAQEAWEAVSEDHHALFRLPRPASDPRGPGHDADVGATYASFEFPPAIPLTELALEPTPNLTNIPLHQQRELLVRELDKLRTSDPAASPSEPHSGRMAQIRARVAE